MDKFTSTLNYNTSQAHALVSPMKKSLTQNFNFNTNSEPKNKRQNNMSLMLPTDASSSFMAQNKSNKEQGSFFNS